MKRLIIISCLASSHFFGDGGQEIFCKKIKDHLLIKDYPLAKQELKIALAQFPQAAVFHRLYIQALSSSGDGIEAYHHYLKSSKIFPEIASDYALIEGFCWAFLEQGEISSQYIVNVSSMVGASLTQDAKAVKILKKYLGSSNAFLRAISSQLISQYGDKILINELTKAFKKETLSYVRCEMMRSLGRLRVKEVEPFLKEILFDKRATFEEKAIAAESLIGMNQGILEKEIDQLISSPCSGLRFFSCQIVSYLNSKEYIKKLAPLLEDTSAEVRVAAMNAMTVVGFCPDDKDLVLPLLYKAIDHADPIVALSAARLLSFHEEEKSFEIFEKYFFSEKPLLRKLAASAMSLSSLKTREKALKWMKVSNDPFVRVNVAYSLLGHHENTALLCDEIAQFLATYSEKIAIESDINPFFKIITASEVGHHPHIPQYPETIDQQTRFHLINALAIMNYPKIEESIKTYLKASPRGLSFAASRALVEEAAEDSIDIVKLLLEDEDESIKVQAALVIGMLGESDKACEVLKKAYPKVDRELKIAILEALGHMGHKDSIPFLMNLLDDPFNMLKIVAASSIIQCIYH